MQRKAVLLLVVSSAFLLYSFPSQAQVSFFQPPTFKGNGTVFVADFNGDGKPDILTSDGTMNLGNGDGSFKQGTSLSNTSVPVLAVADFNGDGKPDVLEQGTGTLLVLLGNGDGTFQAPISTASGASLSPVAAVDLNGDHKADVIGVFNSSLYVYISNGDGTFTAGVPYSLGSNVGSYMVLSFGDFNGDGRIDVAVSIAGSTASGQEIVFLGNGDGTLQSPKTSSGVNYTQYAVVGDFNGDGKPDLAISTGSYPPPTAVYVLLGNGDGTFQTPTLAINSSGPLGLADLNGDGKLDLVLGSPGVAQIYLGNGDGTFTNTRNYQLCLPQQSAYLGPPAAGVITADINSDGKPDIIGCNAVILGNGNGTFQGWPLGLIPNQAAAAVIGRFDKSGAPDVAVASGTNLYILNNDGTGALSLNHTYALQQPGQGIVTADVNGDGNLDLVVIGTDLNSSNWGFSVLLGNGDGSFQTPVFYAQSVTASDIGLSVVAADFNNDHKPDLAVGGISNQTLAIFLGNGDGTFASPVFYFDDGFGPLLLADFNNDGNLDIAAGGTDNSTNPPTMKTAILFGKGDGTFQAAVFPSSLNNFTPPNLTADLRNIGKADLISYDQIALGNGDGTFTILPALTCPSWLGGTPCLIEAVADLNSDGKPDIFIQQGELQIFQSGFQVGNGDGTFGLAIPFPTNSDVTLLSIADMNGDGKPDLIFVWPLGLGGVLNGVGVILNMSTPDFTINSASGSPTSQTVSAGQTASFNLVFGAIESFSGTVNLNCAITPAVTPAPTCNLSSSSVKVSATSSQTITVSVGTTASTTTSAGPRMVFTPGAMFSAFMLSGLALLFARGRRQLRALATPAMAIVLALCMSCGGGSSHHTTQGTPPGTYTATVTASSGGLTHNMSLQVMVQ